MAEDSRIYYYHITNTLNLRTIKQEGLVPSTLDETTKEYRTYVYKNELVAKRQLRNTYQGVLLRFPSSAYIKVYLNKDDYLNLGHYILVTIPNYSLEILNPDSGEYESISNDKLEKVASTIVKKYRLGERGK